MSQYDVTRKNLNKLQRVNILIVILPTFFIITTSLLCFWNTFSNLILVWLGFGAILAIPLIIQNILKKISLRYRRLLDHLHELQTEANKLSLAVDNIYDKYPSRYKGQQFKYAYNLVGKSIRHFEESIAVGMSREKKEVFVTAFVKSNEIVRVTASIGSAFRCSPADNPRLWKQHTERLDCEEIRQYHNHPVYNNCTSPSNTDYKTSAVLKELLSQHSNKLRSFIIFYNEIREWRIIEYDENGKYWLEDEMDITTRINIVEPNSLAADLSLNPRMIETRQSNQDGLF